MRVMTYNIRGGLGMDGRRDTARIAGVVAAHSPDIACFQEVHQRLPWSGWVDQPRRLRKTLGLSFAFQANLHFGLGGYGLGVATRYPIRRVWRHRLPSVGETRGMLEVEIETPDGSVTVVCTHWGLQREERVMQAQALSRRLNEARLPVILCGDLNEHPEADYVTAILQRSALTDCGQTTGLPTYPSDVPSARIDVVCVSSVLRLEQLSVIDADASDHRPVITDLRWQA